MCDVLLMHLIATMLQPQRQSTWMLMSRQEQMLGMKDHFQQPPRVESQSQSQPYKLSGMTMTDGPGYTSRAGALVLLWVVTHG
jgi:hypothetical protein